MKSFFTIEKGSHGGFDHFTVKSKAMNQRADITIYKPEGNFDSLPVVILLHGVYGSHWAWSLKGRVHEVLQKGIDSGTLPPMLLAMPSDGLFQDGSGYLKHHHADFEKWIVEEVPTLVKENYAEVKKESALFLTGLSMGGYGALRLGAKNPNTFKAFSGLSSIIHFEEMKQFVEDFASLKESVVQQENVEEIILQNKDNLNPFQFDCGKDDSLYASNIALHNTLEKHKIEHKFYSHEGGHSWDYWEKHMGQTLAFFAEQLNKDNE